MQKPYGDQPVLGAALEELKSGPFTILGDKAIARLRLYFLVIARESYFRGMRACQESHPKKKRKKRASP